MRVPGEVNGEAVLLAIDTGAPRTTISSSLWRISERDAMSASGTTPSASDEVVVTHGVGPLKSPMEVGVAEMEEDALLGYDVLGGDDFGLVDILLSSNKIVMDGFEIPMNNVVVKAKGVASDVQIPDEAEADVGAIYTCVTDDDVQDLQETNYIKEDDQDPVMRSDVKFARVRDLGRFEISRSSVVPSLRCSTCHGASEDTAIKGRRLYHTKMEKRDGQNHPPWVIARN